VFVFVTSRGKESCVRKSSRSKRQRLLHVAQARESHRIKRKTRRKMRAMLRQRVAESLLGSRRVVVDRSDYW
jgi:hypothetical protein